MRQPVVSLSPCLFVSRPPAGKSVVSVVSLSLCLPPPCRQISCLSCLSCLAVSLSPAPLPANQLSQLSRCLFVSRRPAGKSVVSVVSLSLCLPPRRRPSILPYSIPSGHTSWGSGPRILACGGRLWVLARWSSEAEEVPDCSRLNWWVISNHQPPVTLRAGSQGTGESSREWGGSEALPPPPGLCAWAGYPLSPPSEGGCRGTECCPFFCSICRPQSGRVENETMAFFFPAF